jgi:putative FmdB family regulatory protein
MPTYEYECTRGCRFEIEQSIKHEPLKRCPKAACPRGTGGVSVRRLISAASFILKGGGWYSDGYSGKGAKPKESGASSDSGATAKSGDSGSKPGDSGSKAPASAPASSD